MVKREIMIVRRMYRYDFLSHSHEFFFFGWGGKMAKSFIDFVQDERDRIIYFSFSLSQWCLVWRSQAGVPWGRLIEWWNGHWLIGWLLERFTNFSHSKAILLLVNDYTIILLISLMGLQPKASIPLAHAKTLKSFTLVRFWVSKQDPPLIVFRLTILEL